MRSHRSRFLAAVATLVLAGAGLPLSVAFAAGSAAQGAQCLPGQISTADGSGCLIAPATPVPPAPAQPQAEQAAAEPPAADDGQDPGPEGAVDEDGQAEDPRSCGENETPAEDDCVKPAPKCPAGFAENAQGQCYEVLDRSHPCLVAGRVPAGITTNASLATYTYIPATGECVTQQEFRSRVQNFEASAMEEKQALEELQAVTAEVLALEETLAALDVELLDVRRELLAAEVEARFAEIRRDATEAELSSVRDMLDQERERFKAEAVEAYMGGSNAGVLAGAILSSDDVNELEATIDYASSILENQQNTVNRVAQLEALTARLVQDYTDAITVAQNAAAEIRGVEAEVEALVAQKEGVLAFREQQVQLEAEKIAEIRSDKERYAAALGSEREESKELERIIAEAQRYDGSVETDPSVMSSPADPLIFGSGFGPRLHPILGYVRPHSGVDISAPSGALLRATAPGVVIIAGPNGGYGNTVVIDHGNLLSSLYAHQSSIAVEVGQIVEAGEIIGAVGSTGLSTGPHLHFEVRVSGVPVDPLPYLLGDQRLAVTIDEGESTFAGEDNPAPDDETERDTPSAETEDGTVPTTQSSLGVFTLNQPFRSGKSESD